MSDTSAEHGHDSGPDSEPESERDVSHRRFNSLLKLAGNDFARFAIQVQHVSEDVQKKLIEQLPEFRKLATEALESTGKAHQATLDADERSDEQVHAGYREWRAALVAMLDQADLSLDDKLRITNEIGETVEGQHRLNAEGKSHRKSLFGKVALGAMGVIGVVVLAATGGKFMLDQGSSEG